MESHAYIVGGGPSRNRFDWFSIPDDAALTIACHDAAHVMPYPPTFQLAVDRIYWEHNKPRDGSYGVWVELGQDPKRWAVCEGLLHLQCSSGEDQWAHKWSDRREDGVMVGGCSGVAAMNFAYLLHATDIHLVGIDLNGKDKSRPWGKWAEAFAYACEELRVRDVKVNFHGEWMP